ncbi:ribosomal protein S12 methylthiotransferase accessory factor [Saccharothrix carnea]|uniref:Ribosomal protein S12 methylthiotransferase accessory factor n=1 Tax=Saccharothrix carnea TaxID=1280637 RepID=A0A2P8HLP1_SACCR|nr:TOMM precursor leader peptide-binding protein [Saccharothrix carnea]PSL47139.1 ribosomal protein S12 methylthiotransferase accessory factor [Saccharothrix carnea]
MSVVELTGYTIGDLARVGTDAVVLPIRHDGALTLLGPVVGGGGPGVCLVCAEDTRLAAQSTAVPRRDEDLRLGGVPSPVHGPLIAALTDRVLADPDAYRDRVLAVRTDLSTVSEHRVRPRPDGCPVCAPLPDDTAESAAVVREPVPVAPGTLRGVNPLTDGDALFDALVDQRHGPVVGLSHIGDLSLPAVSARIVTDGEGVQAGFGRTGTFAASERVALFESVERLAGLRPRRTRTVLEASFAELGPDRAVEPTRLGLPDMPSPHVVPYTPDARTRWVHGWSYPRSTAVAVPEHVVYWGRTPGPRFVSETSNGCGTGNSLTEAVLYGLFEVAERDAFLMAWYQRTPLPSLEVRDELTTHLSDRLEQLGYRLECYDATNDLAVPAVLTMARYTGTDSAAPRVFFAAGAGADPDAALRSAAVEVAVDVESAAKRARTDPAEHDRERLLGLLREPELIRTMEDHVAVNGLPEAADRHDFLRPTDPVPPTRPDVPLDDLDALLEHYVTAWAALDLEVIAVDLTDPVERDRLGLHSAKVIVPGTLPMTFGERNRRTHGIPRLRPTGPLLPHPFP